MKTIIFVCLGNICRSAMAEFTAKKLFKEAGLDAKYTLVSRATSLYNEGCDTYYLAKEELKKHNIEVYKHEAHQISKTDFLSADLVLVMDYDNLNNLSFRFKEYNYELNKIHLLKEYINDKSEIADPYYTRDFSKAYEDIYKSIKGLINYLKEENN